MIKILRRPRKSVAFSFAWNIPNPATTDSIHSPCPRFPTLENIRIDIFGLHNRSREEPPYNMN